MRHHPVGTRAAAPVPLDAVELESVLTYAGTTEMHTLVIGQALTGHAAFRR
jgi:glutaryl-CoA dehydrogenase